MSWEGYRPVVISKLGSLVTNFASEKMPQGVSPACRNVRFSPNSVATRWGLSAAIKVPSGAKINGLSVLVRTGQAPAYIPLVFDALGNLYQETLARIDGTGTVAALTSPQLTLLANTYMQMAATFQRAYLAFGDLKVGASDPAVFNGTNLDPLSMRPVGETWVAGASYKVGEIVCPITGNGHIYRCTIAGTAAAVEPAWPTVASSTIVDGGVTWTEANLVFTSTLVGNICTGTRYALVLFVNRNGYISGATTASVQSVTVVASNQQLQAANIPIGPANTAQRIIAFNVPQLDSTGPFWYIPANDLVNTILHTATVINDNTTTTATFNFTDVYFNGLAASGGTDVTNNLRKIKLPPQADIQYNGGTHRIITCGELNQPSLFRVSETDDPETFYGDTGYFYVNRDDGQRAITTREFRGETYAFKEHAAFVVVPSEADPVEWEVTPRFGKVGACGPRAVDSGPDFLAFAHRTGAYTYDGSTPTLITYEIEDQWRLINWDYGHLVSVQIDSEYKEIRICAPMGNSTVPNVVFTCNYGRGIDAPIHYSAFAGKETALEVARKWSIDDIKASQFLRADRTLTRPNLNEPGEHEFTQSQLLCASSEATGYVGAITPGTYSDYGQAINSFYELASAGYGSSIVRFGGVSLSAVGAGVLITTLQGYHGTGKDLRQVELLDSDAKQYYRIQGRGNSRQFGVRFSNGNSVNNWFEIFEVTLFLQPVWAAEFGNAGRQP